jgi:capsular polysaccharide biosynthesis protein
MSFSAIVRAMLHYWHVSAAGLMLSCALAGIAFMLVPPKYTSSGTAVLVRQQRAVTDSSKNAMLDDNGALQTTALTLVQALATPAVKVELGLTPGHGTFTITNVASTPTMADSSDHPFLYVTAQGVAPEQSVNIVSEVMSLAREQLASRQHDLHVPSRYRLQLDSVVEPTTPQRVMVTAFAGAGVVLALGIIATAVTACACARRAQATVSNTGELLWAPNWPENGHAHPTKPSGQAVG